MDFNLAFERVIGHEGGYTTGEGDPGGETKFGISKRAYPQLDIASLTLEKAKAIYLHDYWRAIGCDSVPELLRFDLFDTAVNSGRKRAVQFLQRAAGVPDDGVLGPATLLAISYVGQERLFARFNGHRLDFLNDNPELWARFGRGWAQRIAENLKAA